MLKTSSADAVITSATTLIHALSNPIPETTFYHIGDEKLQVSTNSPTYYLQLYIQEENKRVEQAPRVERPMRVGKSPRVVPPPPVFQTPRVTQVPPEIMIAPPTSTTHPPDTRRVPPAPHHRVHTISPDHYDPVQHTLS